MTENNTIEAFLASLTYHQRVLYIDTFGEVSHQKKMFQEKMRSIVFEFNAIQERIDEKDNVLDDMKQAINVILLDLDLLYLMI